MSEPTRAVDAPEEAGNPSDSTPAADGFEPWVGLSFVEEPPGQLKLVFAPVEELEIPHVTAPPQPASAAADGTGAVVAAPLNEPADDGATAPTEAIPPAPDGSPPDAAEAPVEGSSAAATERPEPPPAAESPRTASTAAPVTPDDLRARAAAAGFADLAFDETQLAEAAAAIQTGVPCLKLIARRVDGRCVVEVAPDASVAWLVIEPPRGGIAAGRSEAEAAIAAAYVTHGVDHAAVDTAIGDQAPRSPVAHATPPVAGANGFLEPLTEVNCSRHPHQDRHGHIDYRDLGSIPYVVAGGPLMRLHAASEGTPGCTVLGTELQATPGTPVQFGVDLPNAGIAADDPSLLVATAGGQPILKPDGIFVEPLIHFDEVSMATGNVDFGGSVEVRGDVHTGLMIKAGGDVLVAGTCESVHINAGGDIIIKGGVIGHTAPAHSSHDDGLPSVDDLAGQAADTAHLLAKGNIAVRHVENAFLRAERAIHIDETALNCDITAIETVTVGTDGKTGRLMGGVVRATDGIVCGTLGAPGASQTLAVVGINPLLQHRLQELKEQLMRGLKQHSDVSKLVKFLKQHPEKAELLEKASLTLRKVTAEVAATLAEERQFEAHLQWSDHAQIVAHQRVMDGTRVMIGKRAHYVGEELGPGVFQIQEDQEGLVYAPIESIRSKPAPTDATGQQAATESTAPSPATGNGGEGDLSPA